MFISTPPKVVAVGFGSWLPATDPPMFEKNTCAKVGMPEALIPFIH